ncbi:hypothetical protein DASC09_047300 [Saccharomycopsis crataegensis]|uniref:Uncharacterized protein n=1 Tax=Saccharomycopsis crataegensis TaxID=43959 RepID=A0AAV5QR47_9ASCO|nr:hypothetical protein DASC09_047300 [Saccharomycopsis crataegensis]
MMVSIKSYQATPRNTDLQKGHHRQKNSENGEINSRSREHHLRKYIPRRFHRKSLPGSNNFDERFHISEYSDRLKNSLNRKLDSINKRIKNIYKHHDYDSDTFIEEIGIGIEEDVKSPAGVFDEFLDKDLALILDEPEELMSNDYEDEDITHSFDELHSK